MTTAAPPGPLADPTERRREQRGWYTYDWANSAFFTVTVTVLIGPYLTVVAKRAACPGQDTDLACHTNLHVLAVPVAPGSLSLYAITAATLLAAVILPTVGAVSDRSERKRFVMTAFAIVGAIAAGGLGLVSGSNWGLGIALLLIAMIAFSCSLVPYDAILIDIAGPDERDAVSSRGWAAGYLGGGLLLAASLVVVSNPELVGMDTSGAVRLSMAIAALWWAGFALLSYRGLRDRTVPAQQRSQRSLLRASLGQLGDTLSHMRGYPQTLRFLIAYLLYNDGVQTVIYASAIFGQEELRMEEDQMIVVILVVQLVGMVGALVFGRLAGRFGAHRTVLSSLVLWGVVVLIGYFLPARQFAMFLGLAVLIGIVLGGSQALSRSLYSHLIPGGREAEYFSFYQAAERGTSWFGTLLFGLVYQLAHSYRLSILAIVVFFAVGFVLLRRVDMRRGITDAGNTMPAVV